MIIRAATMSEAGVDVFPDLAVDVAYVLILIITRVRGCMKTARERETRQNR
jgi:hypothetical protein